MKGFSLDPRDVFIIGGTGFMGRSLSEQLIRRRHSVSVLARPGSEKNVVSGATVFTGNPLDRKTYQHLLKPTHTVVQLAGVSHPNPLKKDQFQKIDFTAGRESVLAASEKRVTNFVYVSVAQPAPIMRAYVDARAGVESLLRQSGLPTTILRPWYVIGPGRRWPLILLPLYWIFENQSATRDVAMRLGFVTREQMAQSLVTAVENPAPGVRIWEVSTIRKGGEGSSLFIGA